MRFSALGREPRGASNAAKSAAVRSRTYSATSGLFVLPWSRGSNNRSSPTISLSLGDLSIARASRVFAAMSRAL